VPADKEDSGAGEKHDEGDDSASEHKLTGVERAHVKLATTEQVRCHNLILHSQQRIHCDVVTFNAGSWRNSDSI